MAEMAVQPLVHWLFQLAMAFLLISFIQVNQYYLRFCVLGCNISFVLLGLFAFPIQIDLIIWNVIQACCNIYHIQRIFKQNHTYIFDNTQQDQDAGYQDLYLNVFKDVISRYQFHTLLNTCLKADYVRGSHTQITSITSPFQQIIILGIVDQDNHQVQILVNSKNKRKPKVLVKALKSWAWIGVAQYVNRYVAQRDNTMDVNLITHRTTTYVKKARHPLKFYRLKVGELLALYNHKVMGSDIARAVMTKMLEFSTKVILRQQKNFGEMVREVAKGQKSLHERSVPSFLQSQLIHKKNKYIPSASSSEFEAEARFFKDSESD